MKRALAVTVVATLAALATVTLPACGGGSASASKASSGTSGSPSKSATPSPAGTKSAESLTAKDSTPSSAGNADGKSETINEVIKVLDDMPSQDELDAAAAARITESTADSEYQALKAEIEADIAKPAEGG